MPERKLERMAGARVNGSGGDDDDDDDDDDGVGVEEVDRADALDLAIGEFSAAYNHYQAGQGILVYPGCSRATLGTSKYLLGSAQCFSSRTP